MQDCKSPPQKFGRRPYTVCATELPGGYFGAFVGADSIRPVVSPAGKQRRRFAPTIHHRTFANEIWLYHVETWYILQYCYITGPIRFCPEICPVGGRLIAAPTQTVPLNHLGGNFGAFVGADSIRPVVSPVGKQRRRFAPTIHHRTFANEIWLYHVETWYILQHCDISGPIWFCPEICRVGGRLIAAPTLVRATLAVMRRRY